MDEKEHKYREKEQEPWKKNLFQNMWWTERISIQTEGNVFQLK